MLMVALSLYCYPCHACGRGDGSLFTAVKFGGTGIVLIVSLLLYYYPCLACGQGVGSLFSAVKFGG
jgi:hypothetical protein